jgi:gas vesicle protein
MADGYDRFDNEGGGGSFVMGLLTGTVLGAGLGMLFAPKAGHELRNQISEQAGNLANTASEGYRRATEAAGDLADRGRDMYDKARDAVSRGADEAQRYVRDTTSSMTGNQPATAGSYGSSSFGGSSASEGMRGSSPEQTRGSSTQPGSPSSGGSRRS